MLKFRVVPTRRMTKSEAVRLLKRAVRNGYVPEGIEIIEMDWQKGTGRRANRGRIDGDLLHDLRAFYGAMTSDATTWESRKLRGRSARAD